MNRIIATAACLLLSNVTLAAHGSTDREEIIAAINCFTTWDLEGGNAASVAPCMSQDVVYQRVNDKGELIRYTPGFDYEGKGRDDYVPYITETEIFGNLAIVKTHKHRDAPKSPYMKAFLLYKLKDGWRITNVVWGSITPAK